MNFYRSTDDVQHECERFCADYCEVCGIDFCKDRGHNCLLDDFDEVDTENLTIGQEPA